MSTITAISALATSFNQLRAHQHLKWHLCPLLFLLDSQVGAHFAKSSVTLIVCRYDRGWFYHRELHLWLTRVSNIEPLVKTNTYERGSYICFDPNTWEMLRKVWISLTLVEPRLINFPPNDLIVFCWIFTTWMDYLVFLQDNFVIYNDMLERRKALPQQ